MQFDYLKNHEHYIQTISELRYIEFGYLSPKKTLADYVQGVEKECNTDHFPITYVAIENDALLGSFSLRVCDLESHAHFTPWMASILVPIEKRKQGIGSQLVKEAEKTAKDLGFSILYLLTPNKAFWYQKLGWIVIENSLLNNILITIMHKILK